MMADARVYLASRTTGTLIVKRPNGRDAPVHDGDVGGEAWCTRAIDDVALRMSRSYFISSTFAAARVH
jgi:hypothetical protein